MNLKDKTVTINLTSTINSSNMTYAGQSSTKWLIILIIYLVPKFQRIWSAGHGQSVRIEISMRVYPKGPVHPSHPVSGGSPGAGTNHTLALYSYIWMFISIVQLRIVPFVSYLPLIQSETMHSRNRGCQIDAYTSRDMHIFPTFSHRRVDEKSIRGNIHVYQVTPT